MKEEILWLTANHIYEELVEFYNWCDTHVAIGTRNWTTAQQIYLKRIVGPIERQCGEIFSSFNEAQD